jgi:hypothetical protein
MEGNQKKYSPYKLLYDRGITFIYTLKYKYISFYVSMLEGTRRNTAHISCCMIGALPSFIH